MFYLFLFLHIAPSFGGNILGVFMYPSISHQKVFQPIWKELSLKGHQVTVITPNPLNETALKNLTEIDISFVYDIVVNSNVQKIYSKDLSHAEATKNYHDILENLVVEELKSEVVEKTLGLSSKFDLVLVQYLHPAWHVLGHYFKAPVVAVTSMDAFGVWYDAVGNPNHPVLYPDFHLDFDSGRLSFWDKVQSVRFFLWHKFYYHFEVLQRANGIARNHFGDVPDISKLERNVGFYFINRNLLLQSSRANVGKILEISPIHLRPTKPLPQDLKLVLDNAKNGVVYVSFGSNVKSVRFDINLRTTILNALAELPFTVLWKWEADHLPDKPENVIIKKWFPQIDLLDHPNIKAFVTHGGQQSIEEAISRKVPMIGLPFFLDQPSNVRKMVEMGIAEGLDMATLTKDALKEAILKVATNQSYKANIEKACKRLLDKPSTGLESAIWWSEYLMRHNGSRFLRSPNVDISWFDFLGMDLWFPCFLALFLLLWIVVNILRVVSAFSCRIYRLLCNCYK